MPDWDEDSPQLRQNLAEVISFVAGSARSREVLKVVDAKAWHREAMQGVEVPNPIFVGTFRGEPGLESVNVQVGGRPGVRSTEVKNQLSDFEIRLTRSVAELDRTVAPRQELDADLLAAVLNLCGWVHAEWVRIHPFANGNGRTARIWANCIAMRYGLPPFVRLRPRPDFGYGAAGAAAMTGDWKPTAVAFRKLLDAFLDG